MCENIMSDIVKKTALLYTTKGSLFWSVLTKFR